MSVDRTLRLRSLISALLSAAVLTCFHALAADAQEEEKKRKADVEGGVTVVGQAVDADRVKDEITVSVDFVATLPVGKGEIALYVEGSSTIHPRHIAAAIPEANGDAGSALDRDDKGRFQVSELKYTFPVGANGSVAAGLLDPPVYLDTSEVANDENAQFLGATFKNNPTIELPDYTLGIVYAGKIGDKTGYTLALTGSNGLADSPNKSYSQLFDVSAPGKGVFAAAEFNWTSDKATYRVGAWTNTADHAELNGASTDESNYGIYALADWTLGAGKANARIGVANEEVSEPAGFVSFALEYPVRKVVLGAGISQTIVSNDAQKADPSLDDTTQVEIYARFDLGHDIHVSPDLQFIRNSGFRSDSTEVDDRLTLIGVRLGYAF